MKPIPKWKMAIVIWMAIYPTINILFLLLGPILEQLPLLLKTLVLTGIMIPTVVFVLLPLLMRVFKKWLSA